MILLIIQKREFISLYSNNEVEKDIEDISGLYFEEFIKIENIELLIMRIK